jgi:hypothetical protein
MAVIKGEKVDALHTFGDLYVSVELNMTDPDAKKANSGKKPPQHYRNISNQGFKNAIIVDNQSVIQFKIRSRGLWGFGYRIDGGVLVQNGRAVMKEVRKDELKMQRDTIAKRRYCFGKDGKNSELTDVDRGYQAAVTDTKATSLIMVQNFRTFGITPTQTVLPAAMMYCTVASWNVYGYIDDIDQDYGMPLNVGEAIYGPRSPMRQPELLVQGEPLADGTRLAEVQALGGAPTRFFPDQGTSGQQFAQGIQIREDDPDRAPSYVSFAFLVSS